MKHLLLSLFIAALLCTTACNKKPNKPNPQPATETETPATSAPEVITQLNLDTPTVVDFYATWCGPCKTIAPILQRLEAKYAGQVKFVRVDVDQNNALAAEWQIEAIPTLLFANDGKVVERSVGAMSESEIEACIQKIL